MATASVSKADVCFSLPGKRGWSVALILSTIPATHNLKPAWSFWSSWPLCSGTKTMLPEVSLNIGVTEESSWWRSRRCFSRVYNDLKVFCKTNTLLELLPFLSYYATRTCFDAESRCKKRKCKNFERWRKIASFINTATNATVVCGFLKFFSRSLNIYFRQNQKFSCYPQGRLEGYILLLAFQTL